MGGVDIGEVSCSGLNDGARTSSQFNRSVSRTDCRFVSQTVSA